MSYTSHAEIEQVVRDFENCTTGKDAFHHEQHLLVATYYLQSLSVEEATERMRNALFNFLDHHRVDTQKYNETLTVFWIAMVALELKKLPANTTLVEKSNSVVTALSNGKLALDFYSDGLLWSDDARKVFVVPDLKQWQ
ncbi:MAG TPA: hypothetical protein VLA93_15595 [Pyrinomonadaceae bacterium]|nr:hypothetical protein [Pyrinomonadaceae bacterium]